MSKDRPGIYLLASISKPMTAAGVMLLSDRGELALDDMLTHTSGFLDRLNENLAMRKRSAPLLELVEKVIRTPLLFKLGERYKYQSIGTLLVAEVCQRITKTSFPDYLDSGLFGTLGMKHSVMGLRNIRIKDTERSQVEKGPPHSGLGKPDAAHWDLERPLLAKLCLTLGWDARHGGGPNRAHGEQNCLGTW